LISTAAYVGTTLLLMSVGLAVLFYYHATQTPLDGNLDPVTQRDLIFPTFVLHHLPSGAGGVLLAALLAAAMSTVDSGLNSVATVMSLELRPNVARGAGDTSSADRTVVDAVEAASPASHVGLAMWLTVVAGAGTTVAAWLLTWLPATWGIYDAIPRTFNAITGPLGGLFLVGMFLPQVRQAAALGATGCGLVLSIVLGYLPALSGWLQSWGCMTPVWPEISFTWILPASFLFTVLVAPVLSLVDPTPVRNVRGLTWWTRHST
jgi:Na+/proline symporter